LKPGTANHPPTAGKLRGQLSQGRFWAALARGFTVPGFLFHPVDRLGAEADSNRKWTGMVQDVSGELPDPLRTGPKCESKLQAEAFTSARIVSLFSLNRC
jgi:hypothetical protein